MNNDIFLSTLGLAKKANKICRGFDMCAEAYDSIHCIFLANDCSERTKRNILEIFEKIGTTPTAIPYSKTELGYALGTKPVGIIGISDEGFAKLLLKKLSKEVPE